ncbi:hypothetical protein BDZ45DRAFT_697332 [Acephala macrosclerotiorum]|nr:hypothetical protein BDZ45DRAFT_697332 [Acephala macrosclerotiorum]
MQLQRISLLSRGNTKLKNEEPLETVIDSERDQPVAKNTTTNAATSQVSFCSRSHFQSRTPMDPLGPVRDFSTPSKSQVTSYSAKHIVENAPLRHTSSSSNTLSEETVHPNRPLDSTELHDIGSASPFVTPAEMKEVTWASFPTISQEPGLLQNHPPKVLYFRTCASSSVQSSKANRLAIECCASIITGEGGEASQTSSPCYR